jgi:hypothetical protein
VVPPIRIRRGDANPQFGKTLTQVRVGIGLPEVEDLKEELIGYTDTLLGRTPSPTDSPYLSLQEVATAYHSRAREIEMLIYDAEQEGAVLRGSPLYKFRTGRLQSFIDMTKRLAELGSRRMTQEELLYRQRLEGGVS